MHLLVPTCRAEMHRDHRPQASHTTPPGAHNLQNHTHSRTRAQTNPRLLHSVGKYSLVLGVAIQSRKVTRVGENLLPWVNLDGSKRNMSRGNSLSDELELSSVLGDTRAYLYSPVWG